MIKNDRNYFSIDSKRLIVICKRTILLLFFTVVQYLSAQQLRVTTVEPPNWWTGMKLNTIQLMVYGENLKNLKATSSSSDIKIVRIHQPENTSYAFIDVEISPSAKPADYKITLASKQGTTSLKFPVIKRKKSQDEHQGFNSSDVIYLITPDRFANGDTTNDRVAGMPDAVNRSERSGRHGGDIQGIIDHLDYLRDLGITTIWINPLVENNMDRVTYHGYAATDLYAIDRRFGSNELYAQLVSESHKRGLKVIIDHVNNHIGTNHRWIQNLPTVDWLNGTTVNHQRSFHSKPELDDIHSDSLTKQKATNGWFSNHMADLNQKNPFVANYLTQNMIWWIEFSGIDGIREDTYPYIDPQFRETWCKTIMNEYPRFNIVGEVWVQDPAFIAPYQRGSYIPRTIKPELPAVTDFGLYDAFLKTFVDSTGSIWNVFNTLAKDFLYPEPNNLVTFLDNHDITRVMYSLKGDSKKLKLALTTLLTTRGIPQLLYATEIGMKGGKDDGTLRSDFPGGFPNDQRNAFTESGRTAEENDIFNFTRQLLKIRSTYKSLQTGTFIHFKPVNEVYAYFRTAQSERVMVIINHNAEKQTIDLSPFTHQLQGSMLLRNAMTGNEIILSGNNNVELDGMTGGIFEIVR
ncbi:MAG: alpha-amylase family glycosyl hydrolase [Bacteroidota bacterium]|nr:alpha-amylase family glycosyl hydrolase [Bacteroidota bacterium]